MNKNRDGHSLNNLINKLKLDKNLTTDLGVRLSENDLKQLKGRIFLIRSGYLISDEKLLKDELTARAWRILAEEMPVAGEVASQVVSGAPGVWSEMEEVFLVIEGLGVVSIRQIGSVILGNSRFWARKLRKELRIN